MITNVSVHVTVTVFCVIAFVVCVECAGKPSLLTIISKNLNVNALFNLD